MEEPLPGVYEVVLLSATAAARVSLEAIRRLPVVVAVLVRDDGDAWLVQMKLLHPVSVSVLQSFSAWVLQGEEGGRGC